MEYIKHYEKNFSDLLNVSNIEKYLKICEKYLKNIGKILEKY